MLVSERRSSPIKEILRWVLAAFIITAGVLHFVVPGQFAKIVPPPFAPYPAVYISGVFEILGGIGLLVPTTSSIAAWGLISLFIAVYPANIYMAVHNIKLDGIPQNPALYWGRLPLQFVLIAWAYWYTSKPKDMPDK